MRRQIPVLVPYRYLKGVMAYHHSEQIYGLHGNRVTISVRGGVGSRCSEDLGQ